MPDFKEAPYDLGAFADVVHCSRGRGDRPARFGAVLETADPGAGKGATVATDVDFGEHWSAPVPVRRRVSQGEYWVEQRFSENDSARVLYGSPRGVWTETQGGLFSGLPGRYTDLMPPVDAPSVVSPWGFEEGHQPGSALEQRFTPAEGSPPVSREDLTEIGENLKRVSGTRSGVFAAAPVRAQPTRTYNPTHQRRDPQGGHVPMYLAQLALRQPAKWESLKGRIQDFGEKAGLFTGLEMRRLAAAESAPFQIQLRTSGEPRNGPMRNLVDVGYGVSQVLPLVVELLREDPPGLMLLQQPEMHLHANAAAEFGNLLCEVVGRSTHKGGPVGQVVVETHSDFIIDRVRAAVLDDTSGLRAEDVSIVHFERDAHTVRIRSISADRPGNIGETPAGYGKFVAEKTLRSVSD